jgi:hypothetical protein
MHIHGMQMNFKQVGLQSARAAENAANAQRTAAVRKKLMTRSESIEDEPNPEESLMIGRWLEGDSYQGQGRNNR